ncbi:MAG: hypothetical protein AAB790_02700 [Patescibacteria group bacterium]
MNNSRVRIVGRDLPTVPDVRLGDDGRVVITMTHVVAEHVWSPKEMDEVGGAPPAEYSSIVDPKAEVVPIG